MHVYIHVYLNTLLDNSTHHDCRGKKHRRFIIQRGHMHTRRGNWSRGGLVERVRIRRHCGPLCSKLVAAVSGSNLHRCRKCQRRRHHSQWANGRGRRRTKRNGRTRKINKISVYTIDEHTHTQKLCSEKDSEAVLGVWRPAPLQTSRAPPCRARFGRWR